MILSYIVSYTGNPIDTFTQSITVNVSLSYPATACTNTTLDGLEEFNNYTVTVQAVNSAGSSDSSTEVVTETDQAGSFRKYQQNEDDSQGFIQDFSFGEETLDQCSISFWEGSVLVK